MRAVVQRVNSASVRVDGKITGEIDKGLCVLLGVGRGDTEQDAVWLADKISGLRIFEDDKGRMNLSVQDIEGSILVVSQFTLYGNCRKGRRPSFVDAAESNRAEYLYEYFSKYIEKKGIPVGTGIFQTHMMIDLQNDGPVTLFIDKTSEVE